MEVLRVETPTISSASSTPIYIFHKTSVGQTFMVLSHIAMGRPTSTGHCCRARTNLWARMKSARKKFYGCRKTRSFSSPMGSMSTSPPDRRTGCEARQHEELFRRLSNQVSSIETEIEQMQRANFPPAERQQSTGVPGRPARIAGRDDFTQGAEHP